MSATLAAPAPVSRANVRVIFAGLMLVLLLAALDQTIVATALPTIVSDRGGLSKLAWVTSAFLLAQTVVTPIYGKLGDLYGRKRILQSAIVLFLAGSALCGQAHSMTELIAFRAVQGLGAGGLVVLIQAVIGDIVPPRERGRYQGLFGAVFGVAASTVWKYSGRKVTAPNSAKPTIADSAPATTKIRLRSNDGGSTGSGTRRSTNRKARIKAIPASATRITSVEAQAHVVPPRLVTSTIALSAPAKSAAPT